MKLKVESRKSKVNSHQPAVGSRRASSKHDASLRAEVQRGTVRAGLQSFGFFFMLCLVAAGARAATLDGTVFDPSGRAVRSAQVSLLTRLALLEERQTDARGRFEFTGLRRGAYRLVATVPGFAASPVQVEVGESETQTVDLRLVLSAVREHVVVSATLGGALSPQVGSSIDVLTRRDMDEQGAQAVFEILREVPGVAVNQSGRRGGVTGVFVRGGNSNYNLVMLDGIQVNQFGGDFDFASLPADGVERVEITRGPQSALYGSNAVTGVINIVSHQGQGPPRFRVQAEGGSFTTRRLATGGSGLTRNLSWAYDLSRLDSGGVVVNDQYRNQSAFLSLGYSRSPRRRLDLHFFGNANDAGAPGPYGSDPLGLFPGIDRISRNKQNLFAYQASYAEQFSPRFRQVASANLATNDYYFRSPYGDSFSRNLRGILNTRSEITVASQDFLVVGFEYNREQIKNTFIADASGKPFLLPRASFAYFAENRWSPSRRWMVITGLRLDDIRTHALPPGAFGLRPVLPASSIAKANPRISVMYLAREGPSSAGALGATRLHGSFGTGIRAASGFELAFTNNPRLKPEKSISFDSGVEQRLFADRAVLNVTYFYNRFKDQIVVLGGSLTNLSSFISDNLANSRAAGVEAALRVRPARSVEFSGNYTRLNSSILALDGTSLTPFPFVVGQPLLRRPRNSAAFNATWQHGRLLLNFNGYVRGKVLDVEPNFGAFGGLFTNPGYVLAGAGFAYRLPRGVELYGRLNNFLNRKYEEALGYPALPLNFLAGVKFTFPAE